MQKEIDKGSTERFGYEWSNYNKIIPDYEIQFLKWIHPIKKEDFKGKKVLDAGCGIGRNSFWPLIYGAKEVTAFDYNKRTIEVAKHNLFKFNNCKVYYDSIYNINYKNVYDIAFSIGVIHHLEDPKKAINSLVRAIKPNGIILIWVYGFEGNEWIVRYINPIRKVSSKLPIQLTHLLTYIFSIPLYFYIRLFKIKGEYLKQLSKFRFWHVHSIVFDQLIPKIANYWKREEVINLFNDQGLTNINIYNVNGNSWTLIGKKKK